MGLFDREANCEKCGGTFPKKQLFEFDASCQGKTSREKGARSADNA